ncbi:hypothetical protein PYCCODRAFT_1266554 [Trametes coccinea BRFM310]|uniref:Uncharacterized protein n=1 Tax=Trametes coccinea (strain BRFM310) TaxID=1353009 RepID=A0A1Y2I610_TRAC3|nr:hypothetical protein PYCCODRAFT_1266554 [Trametes coccinea BRFM310]
MPHSLCLADARARLAPAFFSLRLRVHAFGRSAMPCVLVATARKRPRKPRCVQLLFTLALPLRPNCLCASFMHRFPVMRPTCFRPGPAALFLCSPRQPSVFRSACIPVTSLRFHARLRNCSPPPRSPSSFYPPLARSFHTSIRCSHSPLEAISAKSGGLFPSPHSATRAPVPALLSSSQPPDDCAPSHALPRPPLTHIRFAAPRTFTAVH